MGSKDYSIEFEKTDLSISDISQILNRPIEDITDGIESQTPVSEYEKKIRHLKELSMCFCSLSEEEAKAIGAKSEVKDISPSLELKAPQEDIERIFSFASPNKSLMEQEINWNISQVHADKAWEHATGKGIKVGILDSGIEKSHPDLEIAGGKSFVPGIDDWNDNEDGHGTFCAGIAGARRNSFGVSGVAPEAELYALKISRFGSSKREWMFAGMTWALRNKLDVVSISLWDSSGADEPYEKFWEQWENAAKKLVDNGCVVVGIAGNSGYFEEHWVTNPARCPSFIAVGGTERGRIPWYGSSYGPIDLPENQGVEIAAPGSNVTSTAIGRQYGAGSGTSYACPHVTGAVALLKQSFPDWTPDQIRKRLKDTADDIDPIGRDEKSGFGILNCYRALTDPID